MLGSQRGLWWGSQWLVQFWALNLYAIGHLSERNESLHSVKNLHKVLFIIAKPLNWHIHITEYFSSVKRNHCWIDTDNLDGSWGNCAEWKNSSSRLFSGAHKATCSPSPRDAISQLVPTSSLEFCPASGIGHALPTLTRVWRLPPTDRVTRHQWPRGGPRSISPGMRWGSGPDAGGAVAGDQEEGAQHQRVPPESWVLSAITQGRMLGIPSLVFHINECLVRK